MPSLSSPPSDVLEIAAIAFVGGCYVQLLDGRMYATLGSQSITSKKHTFMVPATSEHLLAWQARQRGLKSITVKTGRQSPDNVMLET